MWLGATLATYVDDDVVAYVYDDVAGYVYDDVLSHPDLRTNPNARIHVRQDQITHMHRRSEYQNTV
jgi:hypothetical protein